MWFFIAGIVAAYMGSGIVAGILETAGAYEDHDRLTSEDRNIILAAMLFGPFVLPCMFVEKMGKRLADRRKARREPGRKPEPWLEEAA